MGISYDPKSRKWELVKEEEKPIVDKIPVSIAGYYTSTYTGGGNVRGGGSTRGPDVFVIGNPPTGVGGGKGNFGFTALPSPTSATLTFDIPVTTETLSTNHPSLEEQLRAANVQTVISISTGRGTTQSIPAEITALRNSIKNQNNAQVKDNARAAAANITIKKNNDVNQKVYDLGTKLQQTKEPGNYLLYKQAIENLEEGTEGIKAIAKNYFDTFYTNEVVSQRDLNTTAKVPFEGFENTIRFSPDYYSTTELGKNSKEIWDKATKSGDLDVLGLYPNYEAYAKFHYTDIGQPESKKRGLRDPGFQPITPTDGFDYLKVEETVPAKTDAERQFERDKIAGDILGLKQTTTPEGVSSYELNDVLTSYGNLVNNNKDLKDQWETAKYEIEYAQRFPKEPKKPWAKVYDAVKEATGIAPEFKSDIGFGELLTKAYQLNPGEYPGASALIKQIKDNKTIGTVDNKLSQYDVALTNITTDAEKIKTQKAGVFQQEFLKDAQAQLIKAKQLEQRFDMLSGTSFGQEVLGLRENIANSIIQESGVGGILNLGAKDTSNLTEQLNLSFDTGQAFGSKNGLLYNWEKWFFDEIEKKYGGGLDVPNDYVPEYARNEDNGFATPEQLSSWKEYDAAFKELEKFPNSYSAQQKTKASNLPKDYIPINERKEIKKEWTDYETARRAQGWVDNKTLASWTQYDDAYENLQKNPNDANAQKIYDQRPADYIPKNKRIDGDVQFAQDFFNEYLIPRFNTSKSISEFMDYINVDRKNQNIFQTEDRVQSLKNAAQSASVQWMRALDSLKPSKFNSQYYFDPGNYYLEKGIGGEGDAPVLLGEQFQKQWGNEIPNRYLNQKKDVESTWDAAKKGEITKDENGNDINWQAKAYMYGLDVNNKEDFAKLHYELLGQTKQYDGAPDVFNPQIAEIYLKQTLMPYLAKKYSEIGTVFGQFANPEKFANEFVENLNLTGNKEERDKVFKLYGLDPDSEDLTQLKKYISEALTGENAVQVREQIKQLNEASETPTQELLGVEYIQRESDKQKIEAKTEDALFKRFKDAGYQGTEESFYSEFMPDTTEEDRKIYQAAQTGKLKDLYTFTPTGDPFTDIGKLESLSTKFEEDETPAYKSTTKTTTSVKPKSKYYSFFPDEDTEEPEEEPSSPVKIKKGSDILADFKSKLNLSPKAGKSSGSGLSDPFSDSFFGSF